jgi:hypothetical protein
MFGEKQRRIDDLTKQLADRDAVIAGYEQHSGYIEVAAQIHAEHAALVESSTGIGSIAVAGFDAYDRAVELVRGREMGRARNEVIQRIAADKAGEIVADMTREIAADPEIIRQADMLVSSPDYQRDIAARAKQRAIQDVVEQSKAAATSQYQDMYAQYVHAESERARMITAMNFEFETNGSAEVYNAKLREFLKSGDQLVVKLGRMYDSKTLETTFTWMEAEDRSGFIYTDADKESLLINTYEFQSFAKSRIVAQLGSALPSVGSFYHEIKKEGNFYLGSVPAPGNKLSPGAVYLLRVDGGRTQDSSTMAIIKGMQFVQRPFVAA